VLEQDKYRAILFLLFGKSLNVFWLMMLFLSL